MKEEGGAAHHIIILPFPLQGHIKPLLNMAELLCSANFQVSFINSHYNHHCLLNAGKIPALKNRWPNLFFQSFSDGLSPGHPRAGPESSAILFSAGPAYKPQLKQFLICGDDDKELRPPPPACIIADSLMSVGIDVAEELNIPVMSFHTQNAHALWLDCHVTQLFGQGEIPGDLNSDKTITTIPGLDNVFRLRDLPDICRFPDINHPVVQFFVNETLAMPRASALIINTFKELESPIVSKLGSLFPKIYNVGPLHGLLKTFSKDPSTSSNGVLHQEDNKCIEWLNSHPPKSVLYVSFGSLFAMPCQQLMEFWYGLVNSESPFLWVIRMDSVMEKDGVHKEIPGELKHVTEKRGHIVLWAPQEKVLAHPAIGGFLTHSGWNSTLESIFEGVPMICWSIFADQHVNSRCVDKVWKIGFDMKDSCDRSIIERMVRDLMKNRREEIAKSTTELARMARDSVKEGGSSYSDFEKLIDHITCLNSDDFKTSNHNK